MRNPPQTPDYTKQFLKVMGRFNDSHGIRELFLDWLELSACAIHQEPYHVFRLPQDETFREIEMQYLAIAKKYKREELDAFTELFSITRQALLQAKTDFLGDIYMQLEIGNKRSGEFFTPFPIAEFMAKASVGASGERIQEEGFITVCEPACGSGVMLVAIAKALDDGGHCPRDAMFFDATDISKPCCDMTYLQTSLLGLYGIVRHGDTLRDTIWSMRFTPICRLFPERIHAFMERVTQQQAGTDAPAPDPYKPVREQLGFVF